MFNFQVHNTLRIAAFFVAVSFMAGVDAVAQHKEAGADEAEQATIQRHFLLNEILSSSREDVFEGEAMLTEEQLKQIKEVATDYNGKAQRLMAKIYGSLADNGDPNQPIASTTIQDARKDAEKEFGTLADDAWEKVQSFLLPHQMARMKQLALQREMIRRAGGDPLAMVAVLSSRLELNDEEMKRLKETVKNVQDEFQKELLALRKKHIEQIYSVLPDKARTKLTELLGEIQFPNQ